MLLCGSGKCTCVHAQLHPHECNMPMSAFPSVSILLGKAVCQLVLLWKGSHTSIYLCVGCKHLPINNSCFLSVFLCLSVSSSQRHFQIERKRLSAESLFQWVFVIASRVIRCPGGSALCSGRQGSNTGLMRAVSKLHLEQKQPC